MVNDSHIVDNARKQQDQEVYRLQRVISTLQKESADLLAKQTENEQTITQVMFENQNLRAELEKTRSELLCCRGKVEAMKREREVVQRLKFSNRGKGGRRGSQDCIGKF